MKLPEMIIGYNMHRKKKRDKWVAVSFYTMKNNAIH
jgi:hypothetical protein